MESKNGAGEKLQNGGRETYNGSKKQSKHGRGEGRGYMIKCFIMLVINSYKGPGKQAECFSFMKPADKVTGDAKQFQGEEKCVPFVRGEI